MAQVNYVSAGTFVRISATGNLTGSLPASPTSGNVLVAFVTMASAGKTIACITSGWTQVTLTGASSASDAIFIAAVGAAAPVFTFTTDAAVVKTCRIIEVSNAQTSAASFVDATGGAASGSSATVTYTALTPSGVERLGVVFIGTNSTNAIGPITGATNGTWVESAADSTGTSSNSAVDTVSLTNGLTTSGGSAAITSVAWSSRSIAIVPASTGGGTPIISKLALLGVG